jgi:hypothetical protein
MAPNVPAVYDIRAARIRALRNKVQGCKFLCRYICCYIWNIFKWRFPFLVFIKIIKILFLKIKCGREVGRDARKIR